MFDRYLDHDISIKSTFIFNSVPQKTKTSNLNSKNVTYIGGLYPSKGFHKLALVWEKVLQKHPDARLNVIGSSTLYAGNSGDGTFSDYEVYIKKIINHSPKVSNSVTFYGLLNATEIESVLLNTSVGVCNPTARTETFCISGVEFSSYGIPVVTRGKNGIPDTIINDYTGLYIKYLKNLDFQICKLLDNKDLRIQLGENGHSYSNFFSIDNSLTKWIELLMTENNDNYIKRSLNFLPVNNIFNNHKYLRLIIYFIRFKLRIKFIPSLIHLESKIFRIIKSLVSN